MKQLIKDVLEDLSRGQVNLGSEAAREVVATTIMITLKEKGEYKKYTDDDLEEQEAREYWVCQICKKSSYDLDWDYIGTGTNHLSCEVRLAIDKDENTEKYQKEKERAKQLIDKSVKNLERRKLSEEIVSNNDTGYIYETPDGGKTVFRRDVGSDKRELVENWKELKKE
jgi:hypothetical protein